jgi:hypothetical protein
MSTVVRKPPKFPESQDKENPWGIWRKNYIEYLEDEAQKEDGAAKSRGFYSVEIERAQTRARVLREVLEDLRAGG